MLTICVTLFANNLVYGQALGQDADAYSSIIYPSLNINLDLSNSNAIFNYYAIVGEEEFGDKLTKGWMIGGDMKFTKEEGIVDLFSDGNVGANTAINGLLARTWEKEKGKYSRGGDSTYLNIKYTQLFLRGGVTGSAFKYSLAPQATELDKRFVDTTFTGWNLELGWNLQHHNYNFVGLSYRLQGANNVDELSKQEFTFTQVDTTIEGGSLMTSSKVTALAGNYDTFFRHSVNFDFIRAFPFQQGDKNSDVFLLLHAYLRHHVYQNSATLKNNTVLGLGVNTFSSKKQKISVGLFAQANDLFGVHKKDTNLGKRIRVGVVARIAFSERLL